MKGRRCTEGKWRKRVVATTKSSDLPIPFSLHSLGWRHPICVNVYERENQKNKCYSLIHQLYPSFGFWNAGNALIAVCMGMLGCNVVFGIHKPVYLASISLHIYRWVKSAAMQLRFSGYACISMLSQFYMQVHEQSIVHRQVMLFSQEFEYMCTYYVEGTDLQDLKAGMSPSVVHGLPGRQNMTYQSFIFQHP